MVSLSKAACLAADSLDFRRYGRKVVADLRARAWAELANAYRICDDLELAGPAYARARELVHAGTQSGFFYTPEFWSSWRFICRTSVAFPRPLGFSANRKDLYWDEWGYDGVFSAHR